jgi:PAS domain S-box-containing protein
MAENINILIVEDDLVDRTQIERLLQRSSLPFKVTTTEYLENASQLIKTNRFDVVLLDLNLPDSRGLDTVVKMSSQQSGAAIVVTTGEGGEEMGTRAIAKGAQDYLIKGEFDMQTLVRAIHYSIERKRAEKERDIMLRRRHDINLLQQALLEATPLEDKLKRVTDDIVNLFDADFCRIWVIKKGDLCGQGCIHALVTEGPHVCQNRDKCLHLVSSSGRYTHIDGETHRRVPFGCYKIGTIASDEDHKFITNDVQNEPRVHNHQWAKELGLVSFTGYQLRVEDKHPLGVMALFSKHPIQESEEVMLDGISSTVALIIQQEQTAKQLRDSKEKYHGLFESSHDAIMTLESPSWKFTSCNPATLKLFGVESEERFLLFGVGDLSPAQQPDGRASADKAKEMIEKAMNDGSNFFEWTHKRINDGDFPATVLLTRMKQGEKVLLQATVRDITEQKKAEELLRRERNKSKKYLDIAGVMMIVLDQGEIIHRVNNKGCEILGYDEKELVGKNWCDNFVSQLYREEVREILNGLLKGETQKYEYHENPILTKSGEERLIAWHNVALWDESKKIYAVLSSGEDITERKAAEVALIKTYKELEKAHGDMKNMQSQLVQNEKLASIGQLAAGVAHEMNTPVGFVASNFETLEKYMAKFRKLLDMYAKTASEISTVDKDQLVLKYAEIKKAAADMKIGFVLEDIDALFKESKEGLDRVTTIIQNLRDFSRIDQAEAFDEFDINRGIEATLAVARNTIKYHSDVITEFADVPHVPCNASQLNQVFLNILVNAAQAIESQHRQTMGSIKIKTFATDEHVVCQIEDDGPGIPPQAIEKVFDPFFTTKPVGKGTGLGLAVSRDIIVNKHKGLLLVESTVGKGAKFTIKLPIKPAKEKSADDKQNQPNAAITNPV